MTRTGPPTGNACGNTAARILKAATGLFGELGYHEATLRRIGEATGVDPALILRYFGSKAGLFVAVVRQAVREVRATPPGENEAARDVARLAMASAFAPPEVKQALGLGLTAVSGNETERAVAFRIRLEPGVCVEVARLLDALTRCDEHKRGNRSA